MKKTIFILFLTLTMITGCNNKKVIPIGSGTIVAFGDSLTFGYGAGMDNSYPSKLSNILNRPVINAGVNGDTSTTALSRLPDVLEQHDPSLVLLAVGGNDMLRGESRNLHANLVKTIDMIEASGSQVVLVAEPLPSLAAMLSGLDDAPVYEAVAKEKKILLIEDVFSDALSNQSYKSDPIHLNATGYKVVAEQIAEKLKKAGAFE